MYPGGFENYEERYNRKNQQKMLINLKNLQIEWFYEAEYFSFFLT